MSENTIHAWIVHDENGEPHVITDDPRPDREGTDWARVEAMTDEEIWANVESDPDTFFPTGEQLERGLLGREIRRLRLGLGLTQERFADRFGIAPETVRDWERGRRWLDATSRTLLRIIVTDPDLVARVVQDDRTRKADAAD